MRFWAQDLLHFWFAERSPADWFRSDSALDAELARRYGRWLVALGASGPEAFLHDRETARAAILLFDQCPRNLFRGEGAAFAFDPLAQQICRAALARGWDRGLALHARQFLLMPLMHSEQIADQRLSLREYGALGDRGIFDFARRHYRMVARFGRFPHRNAVLGRTSTAAERRAVNAGNAW